MDQLQRWRDRLHNLTVSPLTRKSQNDARTQSSHTENDPGDYPDPSHLAQEVARRPIEACETLEIPEDLQSAPQQLQRINDAQCSTFSLLLSAVVLLVSRLTGDEDIAVGTRHGSGVPFVLRTAVDLTEPFSKFFDRVQKV